MISLDDTEGRNLWPHVVHLSLEDAIIGRHQKLIADVASLPQQFANFGDLTSSESQVQQ
jgi:hypothetical protein